MLQRLIDRLTPGPNYDELWLQRMTYQGGWERWGKKNQFAEDTFREKPEGDEFKWLCPQPGRYRAVARKNGRIDRVLWEYETDDASEYYETERRKQEQRRLMMQMGEDELRNEWFDGDRLDELDYSEISDRLDELPE